MALLIGLGALTLAGLAMAEAARLWTPQAPSTDAPWRVRLSLRPDESLRQGLLRAGLRLEDVEGAVVALADAGTPRGTAGGLELDAKVERRPTGGLRLIRLGLGAPGSIGEALTRAADGSFRVNDFQPMAPSAPAAGLLALQGPIEDVLYGQGTGPDATIRARAARLFGERLDLSRDVGLGDRVSLVYAAGARPVLLYAEVDAQKGPTRLYWHQGGAQGGDFIDDAGVKVGQALMRTPVTDARITSGFGMRLHPLLGYTREHQGLDFGAPAGSPVLAAADGVVEQARWAGGYGRWVMLRHSAALETGYGHLSAWARGLHEGGRIRRGQVIGYVGSTGLATGPHLHFEVRRAGRPVDPRLAGPLDDGMLSRVELASFAAERDRIAAFLAQPSVAAARRS